MHKLQEQYLFLARHNIHSAEELVGTIDSLTDKKKRHRQKRAGFIKKGKGAGNFLLRLMRWRL